MSTQLHRTANAIEMPNRFLKNRSNKFRLALYPIALVVLLALVYAGWIREPEPDVDSKLSSASMLAQVGAFEDAEAQLEGVFALEPNNRHAWLIQGLIDERRGNNAAAVRSYRAALRVTPEDKVARDIRFSITDILRRMKNFDAARMELDKLEQDTGELASIHRLRGLIAWGSEDYASARTFFTKAKLLEPDNKELDALNAGILIDEKKRDEALAVLKVIPPEESSAWPYWQTLARSCMEAGDDLGAKMALTKYVQLDQRGKGRLKNDEFWNEHAEAAGLNELLGD